MAIPQTAQDLATARANLTFSPDKIAELLAKGSSITGGSKATRDKISAQIAAEPILSKRQRPYQSRKDVMRDAHIGVNHLLLLKEKYKWSPEEYSVALYAFDQPTGLSLHEGAFTPVINAQGSDEQKAEWLPLCHSHSILGCYMQTELGHGSNVQQLETTATYIQETDEFEIDSPTISSTKWWIGALGLMATHGVVQARLILKGKDMGPHIFIVQLRSLEDHSLLPGVLAGEIGPKAGQGMNATDNGWARFSKVRVSRNRMLSRFASVSSTGEYKKPPHSKLSYGGMIYIRAGMASALGWSLARATTIATRYLHQRRQFGGPAGSETQVFNYPSVYMRILPQIARSIVFITIGKDMANLYSQMAALLSTGDTTLLAETHAVSSGLKVYVSTAVVEGIEVNRRSMGGHGYLESSGIARIYARELPSVTYEGDNYILNMQVARSALSSLAALRKNPNHALTPSSKYLSALGSAPLRLPADVSFASAPGLPLELLSRRATLHVERLEKFGQSGRKWEDLSWECVEACRAIVEVFLLDRISQAVEEGGLLNKGVGAAEKDVLARLITFWKLTLVIGATSDLFEFGILPSGSGVVETLRTELDTVAKGLLKDAIGLTDSFGFSDYHLDSTVGSYDGKAYENLLRVAQDDSDINIGDAAYRREVFEKAIKPILTRGKALRKDSKL